jgi:hypothetical protein
VLTGTQGGSETATIETKRVTCHPADPTYWVESVVAVDRGDFDACQGVVPWADPQNIVGPPDAIGDNGFVSLGPDSGNYIVVKLERSVLDGPGNDLLIYEVGAACPPVVDKACDTYTVYASTRPDTGFVKIETIAADSVVCVDLSGSGLVMARYLKLEQAAADTSFDAGAPCAPYGADFDAIGIINVCPPPDIARICADLAPLVDAACPPGNDWRNHGQYVSCVAHAATRLLRDFDDVCMTEEDSNAIHGCIVSERAQSSVGKPEGRQLQ